MSRARFPWWPVAVWESQRTFLRPDFLFWALFGPLLIVAVFVVIGWFRVRAEKQSTRIAVVVTEPRSTATVALPPLKGFEWVTPAPAESDTGSLRRAVRDRKVAGAVLIGPDFADSGRAALIVYRPSPGWKTRLSDHLRQVARRERAARLGLGEQDLAKVDADVTLIERVADPQRRVERGTRLAAVLVVMLMVMTLFITNSYMAIGITGEKQGRVTEVIISAVKPQDWIDGKIIAYSGVAIVQAVIWALTLFGVVTLTTWMRPPVVSLTTLAVLVLCGVLGSVLYISLWALVLATIKDMMSTTKIQAYLVFMPMVPFIVLEPMLDNPDAGWVMIMTLIPFFAPMLVPARLALNAIAPWEVGLALVLLAAAAWFLRVAAGHAMRIGMLMYGKELSLKELWKWARTE